MLGLSAVLLFTQVLAQAIALDIVGGLGFRYLLGSRDEHHALKGRFVGRLLRATKDLLKTYPAFMALALALVVAGAWLWFAARLADAGLGAASAAFLRRVAWLASVAGLVMMLIRLAA